MHRPNLLTPSAPTISYASAPSSKGIPSPVQYRIEERTRTVYVTTEKPPSQWDTQSVKEIFNLAETPDKEDLAHLEARSSSQKQIYVFTEEGSPVSQVDRNSMRHGSTCSSRPPSIRNDGGMRASNIYPSPSSSRRGSPSAFSPVRQRILFYHSRDPHYGFTNFSPHDVYYKGKRYPTSEHLFQSFKVTLYLCLRSSIS